MHLSMEVPVKGFSKLRFLLCRHNDTGRVADVRQLDLGHLGRHGHGKGGDCEDQQNGGDEWSGDSQQDR